MSVVSPTFSEKASATPPMTPPDPKAAKHVLMRYGSSRPVSNARLDPAKAAAHLIAARQNISEQRVRLGFNPPPPPPCESWPAGVPVLESSLASSSPGSLPGTFPDETFLGIEPGVDSELW
jgi:hypothetical protein